MSSALNKIFIYILPFYEVKKAEQTIEIKVADIIANGQRIIEYEKLPNVDKGLLEKIYNNTFDVKKTIEDNLKIIENNKMLFKDVLSKDFLLEDRLKNLQYTKLISEENGKENYNDNDNIDLNFKFNITTKSKNGQTVTSDPQDFKVTVNDSTPLANNQDLIVYEDNSLQFVLSDEAFKDQKIKIDNNDGNGFKEYSTNDTVKIYEGSKEVGTIKILEGGKLEFKPVEDYSKYDTSDKNKLPNFKYQVSDREWKENLL